MSLTPWSTLCWRRSKNPEVRIAHAPHVSGLEDLAGGSGQLWLDLLLHLQSHFPRTAVWTCASERTRRQVGYVHEVLGVGTRSPHNFGVGYLHRGSTGHISVSCLRLGSRA